MAQPTTMWRCSPPSIPVYFLKTFRRPSLRSKERRSRSLRKPGRPRTARKGSAMSEQLLSALKAIKVPGPDHPITIEHNPNRVVVTVAGRVVSHTGDDII